MDWVTAMMWSRLVRVQMYCCNWAIAPDDYTVTQDGDTLRVDFAGGSITFTGMNDAGLVAVTGHGINTEVLNPGPVETLDSRV